MILTVSGDDNFWATVRPGTLLQAEDGQMYEVVSTVRKERLIEVKDYLPRA